MQEIFLDVSELPAPEPFERIMQSLRKVAESNYLKVVHRKQPLLLYKPLQELGFNFHVQIGQRYPFEIYIWHKNSQSPNDLCLPNIAKLNHNNNQCSNC